MLLDNDGVTDGKAQSSPFTGRLGRIERIEHLVFHLRRYAGAVVANPDLDAVAEVLGRRRQGGLVVVVIRLRLAFGCGIEAVGY